MSEITAVPLRPIKKGSVTRLWIGVAAAVLVAGGIAWAGTHRAGGSACSANDFKGAAKPVTMTSGLMFQTVRPGTGRSPTDQDVALVGYRGALRNGKVFDENPRAPLPVAGMIPGFTEALKLMQIGGTYHFCIPSNLAYGARSPSPAIPPNSPLMFDVQLQDFRSQAEIQAMQMQMQQQQQQGALPAGPPPAH